MSLRLRLFLGLSCLVAVLVAAQWWWVRGLTRDLSDEVGHVALEVGHSLASVFTHESSPGGPGTTTTYDILVAPDGAKEPTVHWVGFEDGKRPEAHWIQVDSEDQPHGESHGHEGEAGRFVRQVKVDTGEEPGKIMLRLDMVTDRAEGESQDAHAGPEGENSWFGLLAAGKPPPESFITVFGTGGGLRRIPIPSEGLTERLVRFRQRMLWGSLGVFGLGLLLSAVVAHRVTAPLQHLAKAAREVGEGALGTQVPLTASGEVGQTIHAFNRMSSELEALDGKTRELRARQHLGEIGEIARGLAHTLRNPLNALGLSVEELAARAPDEAAELAGSARRQIRRIDHSIRSFLALASQGGGVISEVDPAELVQDVALEALQDARGRVRLDVGDATAAPALRAIEPELRAVAQALLVNAVEASPEGGTVKIRVRGEGAERVRIEIEDEGPGLPEEVRGRLFTPHLTTKATGSGMGLFLAHRIATTRYGGRLELEDRPEGGTRAVLELGPRNQELNHG